MMDDMIHKDDAIRFVTESLDAVGSMDTKCAVEAIESIQSVRCIPIVDSHWFRVNPDRGRSDVYQCANCGCRVHLGTFDTDCDYDYCPTCAAVMSMPTEDMNDS